uniref:hypothetical protein n=1 Tax=Agathobacter sp. TaxID=2021311 RepID=UPI004056649C
MYRKRGIGIYFADVWKEGFNPVKNEKVMAQQRELYVDYELPIEEEYRAFVLKFLDTE